MKVPSALLDAHEPLGAWNILLAWRGSIAHGTYTPSDDPDTIDDKDLIGVAVPPASYYFGLREYTEPTLMFTSARMMGRRGTSEIMEGEWDAVVYEARKAIFLLSKGNPNILAMLWVPPDLLISATPAGHLLREQRQLFAVRSTAQTFLGYAADQRRKMLSPYPAHLGYMGEKRKELVKRFGYDTKNASHMIRILRQGSEFLRTGDMQVQRKDAGELLAIKKGEFTKEFVLAEADLLRSELIRAKEESPLPEELDSQRIEHLTREVVMAALEDR